MRRRVPQAAAPLRPQGRPALRLRVGVHQVDARRRCGRVGLLPRGDARGGRGSAVHRAADGHPRVRGRRERRPAGARRRGRRQRTRSSTSGYRRRSSTSRRPRSTSRARPKSNASAVAIWEARTRRARARQRATARDAPLDRPQARGEGTRPRRGLRVPARRPRRASRSRTCRRSFGGAATIAPARRSDVKRHDAAAKRRASGFSRGRNPHSRIRTRSQRGAGRWR